MQFLFLTEFSISSANLARLGPTNNLSHDWDWRETTEDIPHTLFDSLTHADGCDAHENLRGKLATFFNPKNLEFIDTIKVRAGGFRPQNIGFMSQATLFLWLIKFSKNLIPSNS